MAQSIGLVQTAQRLGPALGPVIGGGRRGLVGLRNAFIVTAGFYLVAFVLMLVVYVEPERRQLEADVDGTPRVAFRNVVSFENFLLLMALIFGFNFIDRSLGPVLPLHLPAIGVADARVATASGVIFSAARMRRGLRPSSVRRVSATMGQPPHADDGVIGRRRWERADSCWPGTSGRSAARRRCSGWR